MSAKESKLGALHDKMATVMGAALDQVETQQQVYDLAMSKAKEEEDMDLIPISEPNINPALLSVIERFLSNNNITCLPEEGNVMGELEQKLAAKKERRAKRQVGNVVHLHEDDE